MKTKEDIFANKLNHEEIDYLSNKKGNVFNAMSIYSKQQAILFKDWV